MEKSALSEQDGGSHYLRFPIQPVEFITKNNLPFLQGCVIKRMCRICSPTRSRGENILDLNKAQHEIELIMEFVDKDE